MSTLKEISISGYWNEFPEIMQALILGLATVKSPNKISLMSLANACMHWNVDPDALPGSATIGLLV